MGQHFHTMLHVSGNTVLCHQVFESVVSMKFIQCSVATLAEQLLAPRQQRLLCLQLRARCLSAAEHVEASSGGHNVLCWGAAGGCLGRRRRHTGRRHELGVSSRGLYAHSHAGVHTLFPVRQEIHGGGQAWALHSGRLEGSRLSRWLWVGSGDSLRRPNRCSVLLRRSRGLSSGCISWK